MLRLVFCDVDGTLLPRGESAIRPELCDTLRRLTDRGVTVAIASGRPYHQLRDLFGGLAHRLIFICLDGALTMERNCVLHKRPLPRDAALALLEQYPYAVVHGRETRYALGAARDGAQFVDTPSAIGEPFLKLELFTGYTPPEDPNYRIAYREAGLVELVAPCANKGNAAVKLMQKLGISRDEAVAFGDGDNDVELLSVVGHPYRMRGTLPTSHAPETDDVVTTLRTLFRI